MGELEPWIDEAFIRSLWFGMGENVNVKMIRDKFTGYVSVPFDNPFLLLVILVPTPATVSLIFRLHSLPLRPLPTTDSRFLTPLARSSSTGLVVVVSPNVVVMSVAQNTASSSVTSALRSMKLFLPKFSRANIVRASQPKS